MSTSQSQQDFLREAMQTLGLTRDAFGRRFTKAQAVVFAEVISEESSRLATKADLEAVQLKTSAAISDAKAELVRWVQVGSLRGNRLPHRQRRVCGNT